MVWQELKASDGSVYYYNTDTQKAVREKPEELFTEIDRYLHKTDWRQHKAENGKAYYYNIKTNQSVWEVPSEVQLLIDGDKEKQKLGKVGEALTDSSTTSINDDADGDVVDEKVTSSSKTDTAVDLVNPTEKYHNDSPLLAKKIKVDTTQDAEAIFIEMLREEKVDSTWSFQRILDVFITDPRYWAIEDSLQKKQIFESYLNNRSKDELLKESTSIEKFKASFITLLEGKKEIVYYTRWKTAKSLIQDEPIYAHSVIGEKVKRQTFQEYVDSLRKNHGEKETQLRDQALGELREYFKTMNFNIEATWDSTISTIKQDKRFEQNKHFEVLNQLDLITVYHELITELQKEQRVKLHEQSKINYRSDRRARDGFRELLQELKDSELLRADTKWNEAYELFNEDDRFLEMLGRNGSTPVELFRDLIEEEELLIRAKKGIVEQVLLHQNFFINDETDLAKQKIDIKAILSNDDQTKSFDDDTVDLIYEKLLKDVKEQKEKDRFAQERKLRRLQEDFKAFLRSYREPLITESTKWEDIKTKIDTAREYLALPHDEIRQSTYEKYVTRLGEKRREEEQRKEEEVKRIIASATNARRENNAKKRPLSPKGPVEELDY